MTDPETCRHPEHRRPPNWFHMRPDIYVHTCPACGMERVLNAEVVR